MKNIRYTLRLISTFFSKFKALIILGILGGVAMSFAINLVIPALGNKSTIRIGLTGRFTATTLPSEILNLIGNGLTQIDEKGDVIPNLADSWQSPDKGKTWLFHLREGVNWQDGKPVTANDINYQFSDLSVEKPDQNTLVYKLEHPYSAFPSVVSKPVFKKGLLGTGEWRVKKISLAGDYVTSLTIINNQKEKQIYKFYPTEERTKLAFKLGGVDKISQIHNPKPLDSWKKIKISKDVSMGEYVALFFNTQDPSLSDKTIRQALAYGIDKDILGELRAISPISIDSWAYNPQVKPYNFDQQRATKDIKEGLTINLSTSAILLPIAEKIAKNWEGIGVKTNVEVFSTIPNNYQALLVIFDIPEDPDQYPVWHSTQTNSNISKYSNPRIDKLLEDGRTELNLEERKKIYLDFQRFLVEDSPAVFLYYPTTYTISRK